MSKLKAAVAVISMMGLASGGIAGASSGPSFHVGTHCVSGEHAIAVSASFTASTTQSETIVVARLKWHDAAGRHRVLLAHNVAVPAGTTFKKRHVIHESFVRNIEVLLSTRTEGFAGGSSSFGPC